MRRDTGDACHLVAQQREAVAVLPAQLQRGRRVFCRHHPRARGVRGLDEHRDTLLDRIARLVLLPRAAHRTAPRAADRATHRTAAAACRVGHVSLPCEREIRHVDGRSRVSAASASASYSTSYSTSTTRASPTKGRVG